MPVEIAAADAAVEASTYKVVVSFYDEDDALVTPDSATWSLFDRSGNVINSRADVVISSLSTSVTIMLGDDDLPDSPPGGHIYLRISAVYDSSAGSDLPLEDEIKIPVTSLVDAG